MIDLDYVERQLDNIHDPTWPVRIIRSLCHEDRELREKIPVIILGSRFMFNGKIVQVYGMGGSDNTPSVGLRYVD